jgi:Leucine-rich repeat (LRR) protein
VHHQHPATPNDTFLYLDSSQLTNLPSTFPLHLQTLSAYNNQLASLPDVVWQLTDLEVLNLSANLLTQLPDGVGKLTKFMFDRIKNTDRKEHRSNLFNLRFLPSVFTKILSTKNSLPH